MQEQKFGLKLDFNNHSFWDYFKEPDLEAFRNSIR